MSQSSELEDLTNSTSDTQENFMFLQKTTKFSGIGDFTIELSIVGERATANPFLLVQIKSGAEAKIHSLVALLSAICGRFSRRISVEIHGSRLILNSLIQDVQITD